MSAATTIYRGRLLMLLALLPSAWCATPDEQALLAAIPAARPTAAATPRPAAITPVPLPRAPQAAASAAPAQRLPQASMTPPGATRLAQVAAPGQPVAAAAPIARPTVAPSSVARPSASANRPLPARRPVVRRPIAPIVAAAPAPAETAAPILVGGATPGVAAARFRDPRLVSFPYDPDVTYRIVGRAGLLTTLQFAPDERVTGVYFSDGCVTVEKGGETDTAGEGDPLGQCDASWRIRLTRERDMLIFKPTANGIDNEGKIRTNRRVYEISLYATDQEQWFKRVTWQTRDASLVELDAGDVVSQHRVAAQPERFALPRLAQVPVAPAETFPPLDTARVVVDKLHFAYRIEGDAPFRPEAVFDDGQSTRIKFPAGLDEAPILLSLDGKDRSGELIMYVVEGPYYRFAGVRKQLLLKLGDDEIRLTRRGN